MIVHPRVSVRIRIARAVHEGEPVGESGPDQRTPDIGPVIQQIIGQPGWASGNALVIIVTGTGERVAESYRGDPGGAPLLTIEYR